MAILIAASSLDLSAEERAAFIQNTADVLADEFDDYAVYFGALANDTTSATSANQTHNLVYIPEDFPLDRRRALAIKLHDTAVKITEFRGKFANIVIFKYVDAAGTAHDAAPADRQAA
ncbi:MAG: hypothetical protein LBS56_00350 [Propionibacteriaceae bacterium]|jgi:hypothetical protein|nr:hypothetical protein [Propionibacteriaceae bacterium]